MASKNVKVWHPKVTSVSEQYTIGNSHPARQELFFDLDAWLFWALCLVPQCLPTNGEEVEVDQAIAVHTSPVTEVAIQIMELPNLSMHQSLQERLNSCLCSISQPDLSIKVFDCLAICLEPDRQTELDSNHMQSPESEEKSGCFDYVAMPGQGIGELKMQQLSVS